MVAEAQEKLIAIINLDNSVTILVDSTIHQDYGLAYPLTYQFSLPTAASELTAYKRYSSEEPWSEVEEKHTGEFFNGIEAIRYDSTEAMAYFSVSFGNDSDSLFLKIVNTTGEIVAISYEDISVYYDNRTATVTCSADDWAEWFDSYFPSAVSVFRDHNLWISVGIISEGCNATTWQNIQEQLDLGMVEAASHSRNHLHTPYDDAEYEVFGSKQDIIENLELPPSFRKGAQEYVYVWIAPYGEYDDEIDALVAVNKYLVSRLYSSGVYSFPDWVEERSFYGSVGMSREVGPFWEGSEDIDDLNNSFDTAYGMNGIYHLMCHPHVLSQQGVWEADYIWSHLEYISNRLDVWYASIGQLYVYHLLQDENSYDALAISEDLTTSPSFTLYQNYPNPFNASTTIRFTLEAQSAIELILYNLRGEQEAVLLHRVQDAGSYEFPININSGSINGISSGIYILSLSSGSESQSRKIIVLN